MTSGPALHRKHARLRGWDYSRPGHYYVTVCTRRRGHVLAEVERGQLVLTPLGSVADFFWRQIPLHFPHVVLDEYVVMPDHVHGILRFARWPVRRLGNTGIHAPTPGRSVQLTAPTGGGPRASLDPHAGISPAPGSLPVVVRTWKGAVRQWASENHEPFVWQRGYCDHVVRGPVALWRIRRYVRHNATEFLHNMYSEES